MKAHPPHRGTFFPGSFDVCDRSRIGPGTHRVLDVVDHLQLDAAFPCERVREGRDGTVAASRHRHRLALDP